MANKDHLSILNQGRVTWNQWRDNNPHIQPDLTGLVARKGNFKMFPFQFCILNRADFMNSNFNEAQLEGAKLQNGLLNECDLRKANLSNSDLEGANLAGADLRGAKLEHANAVRADFTNADLSGADFSFCNLEQASLIGARLVGTKLHKSNLDSCYVYGASVWDTDLSEAVQTDLVITPFSEHNPANPYEAERIPTHLSPDRKNEREAFLTVSVTVDNLEIAAFIYLLLNNQSIRRVIDTVTSKCVLILGRFTSERKKVLNELRDGLRNRNYLPILFDFAGPVSRDTSETVSTLAHLSRFIIADISNPRSVPHELMKIVPQLPSLPVQPILASGETGYAMFQDIQRYPWVMETIQYDYKSNTMADTLEAAIVQVELWLQQNH